MGHKTILLSQIVTAIKEVSLEFKEVKLKNDEAPRNNALPNGKDDLR